jgi:hypothetical protein
LECRRAIFSKQEQLGCSYKNPWFRGQERGEWGLLPGLFRRKIPIPSAGTVYTGEKAEDPESARFRVRQIQVLQNKRSTIQKRLLKIINELSATRSRLSAMRAKKKAARPGIPTPRAQNLAREEKSLALQVDELVGESLRLPDEDRRLLDELKDLHKHHDEMSARFHYKSYRRLQGEREAFQAYECRDGKNHLTSSLEILAEMQHHLGETRLLDWSQSLSVAVAWAVKPFYIALKEYWNEVAEARQKKDIVPSEIVPFYMPLIDGLRTYPDWLHRLQTSATLTGWKPVPHSQSG